MIRKKFKWFCDENIYFWCFIFIRSALDPSSIHPIIHTSQNSLLNQQWDVCRMHPFKSPIQGITCTLPVENITSVLFHNPESIRVFVMLDIASSMADTMPERDQWQ